MKLDTHCIDEQIADAILSVLRYYGLFGYPVKADEIYGSMQLACPFSTLLVMLEDMEEAGTIYRCEGYYGLGNNTWDLVVRRKEANKLAAFKKVKATSVGKFIYRFPFVELVGISGSLSKGYADENSDFDFFIITTENRLWICRTLLHMFKKLTFIAGQQHKFCMNYFIDTRNMELEEKNRFTAIELSSLIPVAGHDVYTAFMNKNAWVKNFLPNGYVGFDDRKNKGENSNGILKTLLQTIINSIYPLKINELLMKLTDTKWRKKWARKDYPTEEYDIAFKTTLHVSKNHPANHQKRVLKALAKFDNKNAAL